MVAIKNGKIITPDSIIEDKVLLIEDGRIAGFADSEEGAQRIVDAHGRYIMPGIIDVHSDKIEQFIQPRPTASIDFELALKVCERDLLGAGITTMYHSISLIRSEVLGKHPFRTRENVLKIADLIASIHQRNHLIHHRFHLRIEIDNIEAYDIARDMIERDMVHQISFMDHTPGQGQYRDLEVYSKSVPEREDESIEDLLARHRGKPMLSFEQLRELSELAHKKNLPVASHDDDTVEKLDVNKRLDVDISEFPITLEVAKAAKEQGYHTVVGAPNLLRGTSHSGNMSAEEAIIEGCADILCSDYYPAAILHSIFTLHKKSGLPLPSLVNLATLNPAKAMRTDCDFGSIETGKKADILIVEMLDGYPVVTHMFVEGNSTSRVEYRR